MTKNPEGKPGALKHNPFAELSKLKSASAGPAIAARSATPVSPYTARGVRFHLETQGRSGKVATRITGLPATNLEVIAGRLRRALGCSATLDEKDVVLSGSLAERASDWLARAGDLNALRDDPPVRRPLGDPAAPPADPVRQQSGVPATVRQEPDAPATRRANIRRGQRVSVVLKPDQGSGKLTAGVVREILTSSPNHPRGIKVRLESGEVGRVQVLHD